VGTFVPHILGFNFFFWVGILGFKLLNPEVTFQSKTLDYERHSKATKFEHNKINITSL
jgi:hypothetical protein